MSDLLKIKRLADGDDLFAWRVEAACWQQGVDYTPELLRAVASDPTVVSLAKIESPDTIISNSITDETITAAVSAVHERNNQ